MKFTERDVSPIRSSMSGRNLRPLEMTADDVRNFADLVDIGIGFDSSYLSDIARQLQGAYAFDSNDVGPLPTPGSIQTTASIPTLVQFLQAWLPGLVNYISAARKIDELVGITTIGSWEEEQIVQGMLEPQGNATLYGDYSNAPFSDWNVNFEWRSVVRFEMGLMVGRLEEERSARIRVNTAAEKRNQAARALEIQRNRVGMYGYNSGNNRTYGFLNEPSLPAYVTVPNGVTSGTTSWNTKTFNDITTDIRLGMYTLQVQSMDNIDVEKTAITMAIPMGKNQFLSVTQSVGGISVRQWIRETYPNLRVVTAPELTDANGGATAMYFYAESVDDGSSDDGKTFLQLVPAKFQALGVEKRMKSYLEDYTNATAGILCKRPYAVARFTGI